MGKRGPKKEPTALKLMRGNPSNQPINDREPQPGGKAYPPEWLSDDALAVWHEVAPKLEAMGVLTSADQEALSRYCHEWTVWQSARETIEGVGVIAYTDKGNAYQHPAVGVLHTSDKILRSLEGEFGMTPSSRSAIKIERPKQGVRRRQA